MIKLDKHQWKQPKEPEMIGLERLLSELNTYRKKTIETEEELEKCANLFDSLSSLLLIHEIKLLFLKLDGVPLFMSLIKRQKHFRRYVVKVFDYLTNANQLGCKQLID
jgi:hypothetical protein